MGDARRRKLAGSGHNPPKNRDIRMQPSKKIGIVGNSGNGIIDVFPLLKSLDLIEPYSELSRKIGKDLLK